MNTYILKTTNDKKAIKEIVINDGFSFNPKNKIVTNLCLYDSEHIEKILLRRFIKKYQLLTSIIQTVTDNDDASDDDYMICLDEIEQLLYILIYEYQKYFKDKLFKFFYGELVFLQKALENRFIEKRMFSSGFGSR